MNIVVFSEFPTKNNPTYYSFIKHRIDAIKNKLNVTVITITRDKEFKIIKEKWEGFDVYRVKINDINIPILRHLYFDIQVDKALKSILNKIKIDLIEIHFSQYFSWIVSKHAKKINVPFNIVEHSSRIEKKINQIYFGRRMRNALKKSTITTCVSPYLKKQINKQIRSLDVKVVPNIVNTERFKIFKGEKKHVIPRMITVGTLDHNDKKGYAILIQALSELNSEGLEFYCTIIGSGPNSDNLQLLIKELDLIEHVKLEGQVSNYKLPRYFNESDFFISTSIVETFGVAIVEAMSCGLPVVSTKSGGPESFINKKNGILCDHSVTDVKRAIGVMLETYKDFNAEEIRTQIIKEFSGKVYFQNMLKIYQKTIEKGEL